MLERTIKFFKRYNQNLVFSYITLINYIDDIDIVIEFLKDLEKTYTPKTIYNYYIREFWNVRLENGYTNYFKLDDFIFFATTEFANFAEDITNTLKYI